MIHNLKQRLALITAIFLILTGVIFPVGFYGVKAATTLNYDETDIMEDLRTATVNGSAFNINDYPFNDKGEMKIINFVEYCYSYKTNMQGNYGLYIYVYNPQHININTKTISNKIQIATNYNANDLPSNYEKFSLQFLSKSTEPNYYNLFYKFKVIDSSKKILNRINKKSSERRYDVSGIELFPEGAINATDHTVGGTYTFSGYSDGYGPTNGTKVECDVNELETIALNVANTFYRTGISSLGQNHQNEVNSVYFGVDDTIISYYGKLQKIKAEWYEYKTQPIVVTDYDGLYNKMKGYISKKINTTDLIDTNIPYGFMAEPRQQGSMTVYGWTYNGYYDNPDLAIPLPPTPYIADIKSNNLIYLFKSSGDVESHELKDYIYNYSSRYTTYGESLKIKENDISSDLFIDSVDDGRIRDYNCAEIDTDDKFNMLSYDSTHSWYDKLIDYGLASFWGKDYILDDAYFDINPIYKVIDSDINGSDSEIAKRLLIRQQDIDDFKAYYNEQKRLNKSTYLFRFALTDYKSSDLTVRIHSTGKYLNSNSYVSQQTVFLDFDVIQLTFNKTGVYKVIPVVASPIDIINSVTAPLNSGGCNSINLDNLKKIIIFIIIAVLLIIFAPLLPHMLQAVFFILTLPFRLIIWLFIRKPKYKKNKRKRR